MDALFYAYLDMHWFVQAVIFISILMLMMYVVIPALIITFILGLALFAGAIFLCGAGIYVGSVWVWRRITAVRRSRARRGGAHG